MPRYDRYDFADFRRYHRELDVTYPINWKAFCENSNDDYHVRFVHRRLNERLKGLDTIVRFEGRTCSGYKPHSEGHDVSGGRGDLPVEDLARRLRRLHLPEHDTADLRHRARPRAGRPV